MRTLLKNYMESLYQVAGYRLLLNIVLMIVLGLMEGIGIIMLIPFLTLAGITSNGTAPHTGVFAALGTVSDHISLSLPAVLIIYTILIISQSALQRYQAIVSAQIQQGFVTTLRTRLYQALAYANWSFMLKRRQSDITHILTGELPRVAASTSLFLQLMVTVTVSCIQLCLAFWLAPEITLFTLVSGSIVFVFLHKHVKEARNAGYSLMGYNREMFAELTEYFSGMKELKSHALEERHVKAFGELNRNIENSTLAVTRLQTRTDMLYKSGAALVISLYFYISVGVLKLDPAQLLVIIVIFSRLWPRFASFQNSLQHLANLLPAFSGVTALYDEARKAQETIVRNHGSHTLCVENSIEFKNVCFRYHRATDSINTINTANFYIPALQITAFMGDSGAGKSTLADLLAGLLPPEQGDILIDDVPLTGATLHAWRNSIAYVQQEPFLLHKSIRENLLWIMPEAEESELWNALRLSAAEEFVRRLPKGLDTVVGDRGAKLSGGERQRIVLARALLRKPSLLILDEATSALDSENEHKINEAISNLHGKMTIVVIAHRLSTIRQADQIIVVERGNITGCGTWDELEQRMPHTVMKAYP